MSYGSLQGALKTVLLTLSSRFSAGDVTEGDYRVLDSSQPSVAVLVPGGIRNIATEARVTTYQWSILADIYYKASDDTSIDGFADFRDDVLAKIVSYPTLNTSACVTESISSDGDPVEVYDKIGGGPAWISQRLRVDVAERISQSSGEYA